MQHSAVGLVGLCGEMYVLRPGFRCSFGVRYLAVPGDLMLCFLSILISSAYLHGWLELALLQELALQESSSVNGNPLLRRDALEPGLIDVAGAAVVERVERIVLLIIAHC